MPRRSVVLTETGGRRLPIFILIGAIVVLILILSFLPARQSRPTEIELTEVKAEQLPEYFPGVIPIEAGAKILANFNAAAPDGKIQASRVFESRESVAANFNFYKGYLASNQWIILGEVNDPASPDRKALFAQGAGGVLNVNISKSPNPGATTVDLSFVIQPPR